MSETSMERRLRVSGISVIAGLMIEALSFLGKGPIGFLLFASVGVGLIAIGVVLFLYSLVAVPGPENLDAKKQQFETETTS